jgi:cellulose synthase/poly-beta-1,6-N-acetylglucosamine synthase-like glycosyltransferase
LIGFLYYFLLKLFIYGLFLVVGFLHLWSEKHTPWLERIADLYAPGSLEALPRPRLPRERMALRHHRLNLQQLRRSGCALPPLSRLRHAVIIPVFREQRAVYEACVRSVAASRLPAREHLILVLAVEERGGEELREDCYALREAWRPAFWDFLVIVHPEGLPGEIRGKSANDTWAGRHLAAWLDERGIDSDDVLVSCLDADTVVPPGYFACLTYTFLACPRRLQASFQPIPVFDNNLWNVPGPIRVLAMGSTALQITESTYMDMLVSFSSHSTSLRGLRDSGFWPVDMVAEDSAVYWQSFVHFQGDFRVVPMPISVSMDAPEGDGLAATIGAAYRQIRRWAFGVENFAVAARGLMACRRLSWTRRLASLLKILEVNVMWAAWPFILNILTWLPQVGALLHRNAEFAVFNFARLSESVFRLTSLSMLLLVGISLLLATQRRDRPIPWYKLLLYPLEWVLLLPFTSLVLNGIPAFDAQLRLLFGRRLGFQTVLKKRAP